MALSSNPLTESTRDSHDSSHIILFYKYHPLSSDPEVTEAFRCALEKLSRALCLTGRILVGLGQNEGINGTLAGTYDNVNDFCQTLIGDQESCRNREACDNFNTESSLFFEGIGVEPLRMASEDFKWSRSSQSEPLFPDLNIKLVKELISSGGVMSSIPLAETARGYVTPEEWHELLQSRTDDTILIDCRNTKEYDIGHFDGAIDPHTTTFAQFPKWVQDHRASLHDKRVLMYCTGGIRCEKASAYIRREVGTVKEVKHLRGGIHKYLEAFSGGSAVWKGKNFVFDGRGAASAEETRVTRVGIPADLSKTSPVDVVGHCVHCPDPYDEFDPHCICTVCREPTLVCPKCQAQLVEFHCKQHQHLRTCYFTNLDRFTPDELARQLLALEDLHGEIAVGKKFKQKRKTLWKQCRKIEKRLDVLHSNLGQGPLPPSSMCRNCQDAECSGRCWGFYSLKRKKRLETWDASRSLTKLAKGDPPPAPVVTRLKKSKRDDSLSEISRLALSRPPSSYRDPTTGIRVPPCSTRVLRCFAKGKWCGQPLGRVLREEFAGLSDPAVMEKGLNGGLLRVNDLRVGSQEVDTILVKSSDTLSRIVHWHEPPVVVPEAIEVTKVLLPASIQNEYNVDPEGVVVVCNKPVSVPAHPAGQFLSNSLTLMVEAQENLPSLSLIPLHRIDRVTSGLTLFCTHPDVARLFHRCITGGKVRKLYLAKVQGKFFSCASEADRIPKQEIGRWIWHVDERIVEVDAPVETVDPANGIRAVTEQGKPSKSLFRLLQYIEDEDTSIVACCPQTGRNHQLRVHLQWLGHPIIDDLQYGGPLTTFFDERVADLAVKIMERTCRQPSDECFASEVTHADVAAARSACNVCGHGIVSSFTSAQVLKGGHAICLHAFRYEFIIEHKQVVVSRNRERDNVMRFDVPRPSWAQSLGMSDSDIPWLQLSRE